MNVNPGIVIRNTIQPGDMGYITYLHGKLYAEECGFNHTFEPYVAIPLAEFVKSHTSKERIWIVEKEEEVMGSQAIVRFSDEQAQLRWLLLHPEIRGCGIGKQLVKEAINFTRKCGYSSIFLLTLDILPRAAALYTSKGFVIAEEKKTCMWGVRLTEQKYEMTL